MQSKYKLPERMRKISFDANDHLQMMNRAETIIYKSHDRHLETFPMKRPEDWYILLDSAKYTPFFSAITWVPSCHYNAWRQQQLHTRFDYGYNLYSISDKDIYLVLYRMVAHIYDDGLFRFGKTSIILSDYLNDDDKLLKISENEIIYFNGHHLVVEKNDGIKRYSSDQAQRIQYNVNRKGTIFVLEIFSDKIVIYKVI